VYVSISYFAGILVALVWFLPGWVRCYELLYVHMRNLPFNRVASWVQWGYRRDAVVIWFIENSRVVLQVVVWTLSWLLCVEGYS
jgi:hypothetical protein